ncbi:MAG: HlyC/CorC family transporter [Truepera sp.]|nr:HlyC/CorC family transporter [Truepera sp.]
MLEILIIVALTFANGLFAMSEIAVVSSRRAKLQSMADAGNTRARTALALVESPTRFLATVQIGITLVGIFAGAYGGVTLAQPLAEALGSVSFLAPYRGTLSLVLVVVGITYLSLVIGELVPKRIALNAPERIAMTVAGPMNSLSVAAAPFVKLLSLSTEGLLRLLRVKKSDEPPVSEAEIGALLELGAQAGVFHEAERDIVENLFRLGDRRVATLMRPRREVVWLDLEASLEALRETLARYPYSRLVVARGSLDQVAGVVHTRDLLLTCLSGESVSLEAVIQKPLYILESLPVLKLLEQFKSTGMPFAVVVDEYGSVEGVITLNDLLEGLVGDLPMLDHQDVPMIVPREDGSWLLDGLLSTDELKDLIGTAALPQEEEHDFYTLGGFLVTNLGRIPTIGEVFLWGEWRFEVVDMDGTRVDQVLLTRLPESEIA